MTERTAGDLKSEGMSCPECQSRRVVGAKPKQYAHFFFVVARPLRCEDCGAVFERPASPLLCAASLVVGLSVVVLPLVASLIPAVESLVGRGALSTAKAIWELIIGGSALVGGIWIAYVAVRTTWWSRHYWHRRRA